MAAPAKSAPERSKVSKYLNIQGAPGTGKTRLLLAQYVKACDVVGPDRVLAVTFTRAAADELRERCADALGIREAGWTLRRKLPWVGTIHSMCLKLADINSSKLIDSKKLREFDKRLDGKFVPSPEQMDALMLDEPGRKSADVEVALWCRAAALHRMVDLEEVWPLVDDELAAQMSFPAIRRLVENYEKWKESHGFCDFEDLLLLGRDLRPPVRVVLADECQDNSPLLWSVINAWGQATATASYVCAGDAYQALYSFAGGDPRLFSSREGAWHVIRESHRFDNASAQYARQILAPAFGRDERFEHLSDFEGIGGTAPDPSSFWLARTNSLVQQKSAILESEGIPFHFIRGRAPLQTRSADAYRAILRAEGGNMVSKDDLLAISEGIRDQRGYQTAIARKAAAYIKSLPSGFYGAGTVEAAFGISLRGLCSQLPDISYFTRVKARYGEDGIFKTPNQKLGTIHSAKGKEAGSVTLCTSWATRPAANLRSIEGRRAEACCAYVGSSRHRSLLVLESLPGAGGGVYPFPPLRRNGADA